MCNRHYVINSFEVESTIVKCAVLFFECKKQFEENKPLYVEFMNDVRKQAKTRNFLTVRYVSHSTNLVCFDEYDLVANGEVLKTGIDEKGRYVEIEECAVCT